MTAKRFVPRPDWVIVGNHTYTIHWCDPVEMEQHTRRENTDGATYDTEHIIFIKLYENANESHYQEVLMHELTHAVWGTTKLTLAIDDLVKTPDPEENIILFQSPGMLALLRENPDVVKYLMSTR